MSWSGASPWRATAAFAAVVFIASTARAQVNVEPLRRQVKAQGFSGSVQGSIEGSTGNTEGITAGAGMLFGVGGGPHLLFLNATGNYSRINGSLLVDKSFAHLRYNYEILNWLWAEVFTQIENDNFRRIQDRELVGTGPRFGLLQGKQVSIYYGTAYMLERTRLNAEIAGSSRSTIAHRWSNYVALGYQAGQRVQLTNTTYYQPRFDDFSDYHLLSVTGLDFKVTPVLHTQISSSVRYESRVPLGVRTTDVDVKNSIVLKF
jgi:hypothetical protein